MPILILKFKDNMIQEEKLDKGSALTIGRKSHNDIVIENLAVSGDHAKIDSVGDGFLLTDLQSKNGTTVNDMPINSHYLNNADIIVIGKHELIFKYQEGEEQPADAGGSGMDQTMVMDTDQQRDMLSKTVSQEEDDKKGEKKASGVLTFLAGGEGEFGLSKKLIKIGKDSTCDIVISGMMIGKTAATISIRPNGYYFSYVSGMSKPKINSEAVKGTVKLEEFDTIEIGGTKMQFVLK